MLQRCDVNIYGSLGSCQQPSFNSRDSSCLSSLIGFQTVHFSSLQNSLQLSRLCRVVIITFAASEYKDSLFRKSITSVSVTQLGKDFPLPFRLSWLPISHFHRYVSVWKSLQYRALGSALALQGVCLFVDSNTELSSLTECCRPHQRAPYPPNYCMIYSITSRGHTSTASNQRK